MPPEPPPAADLTSTTGRHAADVADDEGPQPDPYADPYADLYAAYEKPAERPGYPADTAASPFPAPARRRRRRAAVDMSAPALDEAAPDDLAGSLLPRDPSAAPAVIPGARPAPAISGPLELELPEVACPPSGVAADVETTAETALTPPRRPTDTGGIRRRDLRLVTQAAQIIKRDKRRRWIAAGTLVTVVGTISIPSIIMNVAQAEGISSGTFNLKPGGSGFTDSGVKLADGTATSTFTLPSRPTGSLYLAVEMRGTKQGAYRAKVRVYPDGQMNVGLSKVVGGSETLLGNRLLGARLASGGSSLHIQGAVSKTDPTTLRVRAWLDGTKQPDFQFTAKDTTPALVNGSVRAWSYLSANASGPLTVTFRNLGGEKGTTGPSPVTPPTVAPSEPVFPTPTYTPSGTATSVKPSATNTAGPTPTNSASTPPGGGGGGGGTPGAGNTGVPSGTNLKVHNGDLVVTKAGSTYDGLDIKGFVDIRAADVTIKNSLIRGGKVGGGNRAVINVTDTGARRFLLQDSEVRPANPSVRLDGVNGANFTLRRVEIDGGVDASKVFGNNVTIESSWLHGTQKFSSDPNQGGGATHNDAIQVQGGQNVTIKNNRIEGGSTSAIMVTQDFASTKGLTISGNRLNGGTCTVNITPSGEPSVGPITLTDNVFVKDSEVANCSVARTASTQMTASGNTFTDGSAAKINVWN